MYCGCAEIDHWSGHEACSGNSVEPMTKFKMSTSVIEYVGACALSS